MSDINFGKNHTYERFYNISHIAALAVCVLMGIFAILTEKGYIYFPPIFLVTSLINLINAYDTLRLVRRTNKSKRLGIITLIFACLLFILFIISILCFWT